MVCLEAMAAGKPVICLDLGGPAVQVTRETGFKVLARDSEQVIEVIAQHMRQLAENEDLRRAMGAAGRRRVREVFSWEIKGQQMNSYYEEAVRNRCDSSYHVAA